jgi:hypothetical protein
MNNLLILFYVLVVITVVGHGIWATIRWLIQQFTGSGSGSRQQAAEAQRCANCGFLMAVSADFCGHCGCLRLSGIVVELLKDLRATERQAERFYRAGAIDDETFQQLQEKIEAERLRLTSRRPASSATPYPAPAPATDATPPQPASVTEPTSDGLVPAPAPVFLAASGDIQEPVTEPPFGPGIPDQDGTLEDQRVAFLPRHGRGHRYTPTELPFRATAGPVPSVFVSAPAPPTQRPTPLPPPPPPPRKPFTEVLAAFMEQSNIRWGEIVGGLLIIGCSTALVVSLWAQISRIPVLKFLIFTTVTAAMFGVGLYTEHRWKLPTTSRGILTIATLLVPLNFLAIAAVSGSTIPPGALVIGSELIAPALFLCLVYFAGRVITRKWPHLLAAGVLGSSVGQLLIRHFASPDNSSTLLLLLGAFPVVCYVAAAGWMLWIALADKEIDENEAISIFVTLGAITFAAALPFGLLLYKSGPVSMTMMYLAPLVTLAGVPLLASGTLVWQRVTNKELAASRTAGTSIAVAGSMVVLSGMVLAWPNPASIVPAALFNFVVFTALAVLLELPIAHLFAAGCFALAYLVSYHVIAGHIYWQNLRVMSLLGVLTTVSSGQALAAIFLLFIGLAEWLTRKGRTLDSQSYLIAACVAAAFSLIFVTVYGASVDGDPHFVWCFYLLYAAGAFWISWRNQAEVFGWIGSGLLLFSFVQALGPWLGLNTPWQSASLAHASVCAIAAIVCSRYEGARRTMTRPLNLSALVISFLVIWLLLFNAAEETPGMLAQRVFWLAGVWFVLLWLNRKQALFASFQIALTMGLVLAIKGTLQQYDWYAFLPHAFLHPSALQIQGTALVLLSLAWITVRFVVRQQCEQHVRLQSDKLKFVEPEHVDPPREGKSERAVYAHGEHWSHAAWRLLNARVALDRLVSWIVLSGFVLLTMYGAFSGVKQELTARGNDTPVWNITGFPHQSGRGLGASILLGLLVIAMLATLWERRRGVYLLAAITALAGGCPLLAGSWETQMATASAWRWIAALFLLLFSLPLWCRSRLKAQLSAYRWPAIDFGAENLAHQTRLLLLITALAPLLVLTAYPALRAIYYLPVHGPAGGIFYFLDDDFSYSVPLVVAGLVLIGYAVRERLATYAFGAGLFFNLTATMVYLLSVVAVNGSMDRVVFAHTIQLNAMTAAVYALVWLGAHHRWLHKLTGSDAATSEKLFKLQIAMAIAMNALIIVPVTARLIVRPELAGIGTTAGGSFYGWLAVFLSAAAAGWFGKAYGKRVSAGSLCAAFGTVGCLVAFTFARWSPAPWAGFHALMIGSAVAAWLMCLAGSLPALVERRLLGPVSDLFEQVGKPQFAKNWSRDTALFATFVGLFTVSLALRATPSDPVSSWWPIGVLLAISALAATLSWQTLSRVYLYAAQILLSAALTVWWFTRLHPWPDWPAEFLKAHVVALTLPSILWLLFELRARRLAPSQTIGNTALSFHNPGALLSLLIMGGMVSVNVMADMSSVSVAPHSVALGWLALASLAALLISCLWDQQAKYAVAGLYLLGLIKAAWLLHEFHLSRHNLGSAVMMVMAAHAVGAALIWHWRRPLMEWTSRLQIPARIDPEATELRWLVVFNGLLIAAVIGLAFRVDLRFSELTLRLTAALAVAAQSLSFALMAEGKARQRWKRAAFAMFTLGAVFFGWAWLVPGTSGTWLNRAVILMVEMFGIVALFGLELDKAIEREPEWTRSLRDCVPWLTGAGSVALAFILCTEVVQQIEFGSVHIGLLSLVTVALTLAGAAVICILFALSPAHDPLNLPENRRNSYVYIAEVMLALQFMHIRLTMPWLFTGFFELYWPLVVVAIAYLGVATSELLRRRNVLVLADPIERTGALLPLLPVLGFWLTQSPVDYSVLLFIVGGLYGGLSILRRSFGFGILAAVASNGGLWYMLHRTDDYGFLLHPQLWLIPAALSVLVAVYLNREDFSEEQMIGIRYLTLVTIYASSTGDIFINGVARSPWLPMILAALSLAGVFSGIMFRVRALLLLGSVFLLLAITTMIYYASFNFGWTWLWYVAGIVTGAMIIFTFALFEKKRAEVLRVVDGLKDWQR